MTFDSAKTNDFVNITRNINHNGRIIDSLLPISVKFC